MNKKTVSQMGGQDHLDRQNTNKKLEQLDAHRRDATEQALTTNQGVKIADNQNSLKAGTRGSTLLEDFILREKITHFDHERIPERIVHARGVAAHTPPALLICHKYRAPEDVLRAAYARLRQG